MQLTLFEDLNTSKYPKVNYIGNKEKLSKWIINSFPIKSGVILDLFSGGGSVSFEAKKNNFTVYSNDALYASFVVGKAIIENKEKKLQIEDIKKAISFNISDNQRKKYKWLDNNLFFPSEVDELAKFAEYSLTLPYYEKYLLQSLIRRAMIRKLPYSRMNVDWQNIQKLRDEEYSYNKYGRKRAYHNKSFFEHILLNVEEYNNSIFDNLKHNKVFQMDALDLLKRIEPVDLIYLDPPYPSTMNNYDSFYGAFGKLFDSNIDHIDLTKKTSFLDEFKEIIKFSILKANFLVISLNSKSNPGIEEIKSIIEPFGQVEIISKKHNYQVSGKKAKNGNLELLAILKIMQK